MQATLHILAADSDESIIRTAFFGIVIIIWIVSAIATSAKKSIEQQRRRLKQTREAMGMAQPTSPSPPAQPRAPARLAPAIARRVPPPVFMRAQSSKKLSAVQRAALAKKAAAAKASRPMPPPIQAKPSPLSAVQPAAPAAAFVSSRITSLARKPATIGALAIKGWLKPATLQQQFILTELFQPPLALRDRTP